jgi:hypothetical protein
MSLFIREIHLRMYFQEKSPYTKDRPHEREGRESRDKQYPFYKSHKYIEQTK